MSLPHWEDAMGSCFHFELVVRLLAGKFWPAESVTNKIGDQPGKPGLLTKLFQEVPFTAVEKEFLPKCNTLRNKLIHCEPDALARLIQDLVPTFQPPNLVQQIPLPDTTTSGSIIAAIEHRTGAVDVQATVSREEGFFGWMLQAAGDGTFDHAIAILKRGVETVRAKIG